MSETNILNVTYTAYRKMVLVSKIVHEKHDEEVLGLLVVDEGKNGKGLTVSDIIIPEQEIGSADCKMKVGETLSQKEIPKGKVKKIKGWFHSHKKMGTFYSYTDDNTLENWAYALPYAIGVVVSLPSDLKAWIQYGKPYLSAKQELEIRIVVDNEPEFKEKLEKELEKKIIKKETKTYTYTPKQTTTKRDKTRPTDYTKMTIGELPKSTFWNCPYLVTEDTEDVYCIMNQKSPYCAECEFREGVKACMKSNKTPTIKELKRASKKKKKHVTIDKRVYVKVDCNDLFILTNNGKMISYSVASRPMKKQAFNGKHHFICRQWGRSANCKNCANINKVKQQPKCTLEYRGAYVLLKAYCDVVKEVVPAELDCNRDWLDTQFKGGFNVQLSINDCEHDKCNKHNHKGCLINRKYLIHPDGSVAPLNKTYPTNKKENN